MKYKLIHSQTKEEHLCDKVTIDGFDYYVSDEEIFNQEWYYWTVTHTIRKTFKDSLERLPNVKDGSKKVIATNNPNIDIPKVVDEVEVKKLALQETTDIDNSQFDRGVVYGFIKGYKKSQETHPFSEEDMIEFAEWCANSHYHYYFDGEKWSWGNSHNQHYCSTKELLQLWKEQQPKTIYYN